MSTKPQPTVMDNIMVKQAVEKATRLAFESKWKKTHRKGETMPNFDDKRTKLQKRQESKKNWKDKLSLGFLKSDRTKYIEYQIARFEKTGNTKKADFYRSKLKETRKLLRLSKK